ncbi:MAG: N-acetylmuramoyl-L-alanine amidase [Acutalibacteraceae bacterium]
MVLNKKDLLKVSLIITTVLLFSAFVMHGCCSQITNVVKNNDSITIVIDAGHGGEDGGAVAGDGTLEKDINLSIATYLCQFLKNNDINIIMTRNNDIAIYDEGCSNIKEKKVSDMHNRLKIFNDNSVSMVVSIHQNKFEQSKYWGTQVFYSTNDSNSKLLAENIKKSITSMLQTENKRECKEATKSIYLLHNSQKPSVIVECGFLSNPDELAKLKTEEYQKQMAFSIFCGCMEYLVDNKLM